MTSTHTTGGENTTTTGKTPATASKAQSPQVAAREAHLPPNTVLERLALSDKGFVFDPVTGNSFTANVTGLALLRMFQRERDLTELVAQVTREYELDPFDAEREILDFAALLRATLRP
ncbi:MAG: PqqD family protein [Burkholderiales bacterium]